MKYEGTASIKCVVLSHIPGWVSRQEGDGPVGEALTAGDSGISSCQMCPLIPIYQRFHGSGAFPETAALLARARRFAVKCQANSM